MYGWQEGGAHHTGMHSCLDHVFIVDGKLLFNQLPLLEIDGLNLKQSTAIVRYIGDRGGLVPKDPKDKYR